MNEMEVINKKHNQITTGEHKGRYGLTPFISFENKKYIYFSAGAAKDFGLKTGLKINFINDGYDWLFYSSNVEPDGFDLIERGERGSKNAVLICNAALIQLFLKRTHFSLPCKFLLTLTGSSHNGNHLIKIELNKPFEINPNVVLRKPV